MKATVEASRLRLEREGGADEYEKSGEDSEAAAIKPDLVGQA